MTRLAPALLALLTCGCLQGYDRTVTVHVRDPLAVRAEVTTPAGHRVILPADGPRNVQVPLPTEAPPVVYPFPGGAGLALRREASGAVTLAGGRTYHSREILGADGASRTFSYRAIAASEAVPDHRVTLEDGELRVSCPVYVSTGNRGVGWYLDVDLVTPVANVVDARDIKEPQRVSGGVMLFAGVALLALGSVMLALPGRGKPAPGIVALDVGLGFAPGAFLTGTGQINLVWPRSDRARFPVAPRR